MKRSNTAAGTLPLESRPRTLSLECFTLTVESGPNKGASVRGEGAEVLVGSAEGNTLHLTDPSVSRHHFSVISAPDGITIRDSGSTNGTRVNGCKVEVAQIEDQAVIEVGRTRIRLDPLNDTVTEALSPEDRYGPILGRTSTMRRIFAMLPALAGSQSTLLLEGETGTGKGALAEAIHDASPRANAPFVVLDCSSIPPTLVESELFGHVRGSFTGAHADRAGAFEQAAGGTIFLDEIGEMPLDMQPKLLRALEERMVKRVGGRSPIALDVRVIAATNRDLRSEANRGNFRSDLYFRLNVLKLTVPPLRERAGDIPLLLAYFYEQLKPGRPVPKALIERSIHRRWPGNVRELRSSVERWVLLHEIGVRTEDSVEMHVEDAPAAPPAAEPKAATGALSPAAFDPKVPFRLAKEQVVTAWERDYLQQLTDHVGGNLSAASRVAGIDRGHLRELMRKHGVRSGG